MRNITIKNYIILAIIVIITIFITFLVFNYYKKSNVKTSVLYNNIQEIKEKGIKDYIIEKPIIYMYISDKYDINNSIFEKKLLSKIKKRNIKDDFVFIDKKTVDDNFKKYFKEEYKIDIDIDNYPIIIILNEKKIIEINYVDVYNCDVDDLIDYEVIK